VFIARGKFKSIASLIHPRLAFKIRTSLVGAPFCFAAVCFLFISCSEKPAWRAFTPVDGDFSISAPGQLSDASESFQTALGAIPRHRYSVSVGATYFGVERQNYPRGALAYLPPSEGLDAIRDDAVKLLQGRLLTDTPKTIGNLHCRDFKIECDGGRTIARSRVFLVGDHVYAITVVASLRDAEDPAIGTFIESFHLL